MATGVLTTATTSSRRALVRAFDALCEGGPLTRAGFVQALGTSGSTITTAVHQLRILGFVTETGTAASTGGRPPTLIGLSASLGCVIAVDVGAINVRVAAADVAGTILERRTFTTSSATTSRRFRDALVTALDEVAQAAPGPVLAITIAVPAVVHPETRKVSLATVPAWPPGDPARWLERFEAPVLVENEANLAAVGEAVRGSARGASNVLFVAVGAGVGAGILVGGNLYRGSSGAAGEIGLLRLSTKESPPSLEDAAGATATVRRYAERGAAATAESVFGRAKRGDAAARTSVDAMIDNLAVGIANAVAVLDPEIVVVGGGLSAARVELLDPLAKRIRSLVPSMPEFVAATLGPDAALVGATVLAARDAQARLRARLEAVAGQL